MDSDKKPTITDDADAAWTTAQRECIVDYLRTQNVEHAGVSIEPRWFLRPFVAIWAVRSKARPDRIGWWAISGDLPTDYLASSKERDNADVLLSFAGQWRAAAAQMERGGHLTGYRIGPTGLAKELAPMLLRRAELLEDFAKEMKSSGPEGEE